MKTLTLIALVIITIHANAQLENGRHLDTRQNYTTDQQMYEFNMHGTYQGLYFNGIVCEKSPYFEVSIINNTQSIIINHYRERDSRIVYMRKNGRYDTLMPGEKMTLRARWSPPNFIGTFNCSINLKYQIGDSIYINQIKVWGYTRSNVTPQISEPNKSIIAKPTIVDSFSLFVYKFDSSEVQLYNNDVSIKFRSLNSSDSSFVTLDFQDEKTLFLNRKSSGWLELEITDRDGTSYIRKLFAPLYRRTKNKPILYIGEFDYLYFTQGVIRPCQPIMDMVYIWSDNKITRNEYRSILDKIGINSISHKFPAIHEYSQDTTMTFQFEELLKLDSILVSPVYKFEDDHCRYWSNQVEVLTDPNLNEEKLNDLLNSIGIPNAFAINKYSRLEDYSNCSAFRIEFDTHDMLSYEFLIKLEKLYNMIPIYKIFTHGIQGVYSDRYGVH